jgi:3',5'-cyclic AMP phosphodiesterase CpdA
VLMLDWAKDEAVLFPKVQDGVKSGYNPLFPGDAAGSVTARSCPTALQQKLVADFLGGPSRAKVVGVHAPPIGPYWDWSDADLLQSKKTYSDPAKARGPKGGHPLFATTPSQASGTPFGMVADRGSLGKAKERDWLIKLLSDSRYGVRMVLSGHIHRSGLYVVYPSTKPIEVTNPKDSFRNRRVENPLLVGGLYPQAARGAPPFVTADRRKGPLYITTTSAGPRGNFEKRPLTPRELASSGTTVDPGYTQLELANDGTIRSVKFWGGLAPAEKTAGAPARQREVAYGMR